MLIPKWKITAFYSISILLKCRNRYVVILILCKSELNLFNICSYITYSYVRSERKFEEPADHSIDWMKVIWFSFFLSNSNRQKCVLCSGSQQDVSVVCHRHLLSLPTHFHLVMKRSKSDVNFRWMLHPIIYCSLEVCKA